MLGDNMSVIVKTTLPSTVLKRKANAIYYHKIRESIACKIMKLSFVKSEENLSDIFTKALDKPLFFSITKKYLFRKPKHIMDMKQKVVQDNV